MHPQLRDTDFGRLRRTIGTSGFRCNVLALTLP